jgi:hypothetical protein
MSGSRSSNQIFLKIAPSQNWVLYIPANVVLVPAAWMDPITVMEITSSCIIIVIEHVGDSKPKSI